MEGKKLVFRTRSMTTLIDYDKCEPAKKNTSTPSCGFACVKADRMYDRSILRIEGNRPVLAVPEETAQKMSNESLSAWSVAGPGGITIVVEFPGMEAYREERLLGRQ